MRNHFLLMMIFSVLTSVVFTFILKHDAKERIQCFILFFCSFILLSVVAGWLMYPFPF